MKTLIEFQDYDVLTNLSSILSVRPDRVIFIYDRNLSTKNSIQYTYEACKEHLPKLEYQIYSINSTNLNSLYGFIKDLVEESKECLIDLTGGSELMVIAGFKAGMDAGASLIYADLVKKHILDIKSNTVFCSFAEIKLEDYVAAKGARLLENSHIEPDVNSYLPIMKMSRIIFNNLYQWKKTCAYFQKVMSGTENRLFFHGKSVIDSHQGKTLEPDLRLIDKMQELGFIKDLETSKESIQFTFVSQMYKQYLLTYGIWLELFVYISAKKVDRFEEARLGIVIDWTAHDGFSISGNEIDVVLMRNSAPILISCKLTEPDSDDLNEILITAKRLGGLHARSVLVTFSNIKKDNTGIYKRAKELGIIIFDKQDILRSGFSEKLSLTFR